MAYGGFELDEAKSRANAAKHGIDFVAAQPLWLDECLIVVPAETVDELRSLVVGRIEGEHYSTRGSPKPSRTLSTTLTCLRRRVLANLRVARTSTFPRGWSTP